MNSNLIYDENVAVQKSHQACSWVAGCGKHYFMDCLQQLSVTSFKRAVSTGFETRLIKVYLWFKPESNQRIYLGDKKILM